MVLHVFERLFEGDELINNGGKTIERVTISEDKGENLNIKDIADTLKSNKWKTYHLFHYVSGPFKIDWQNYLNASLPEDTLEKRQPAPRQRKKTYHLKHIEYANRPDAYGVPDSFGDVPTFDCFDKETRLKISTAIDNCYGELDEAIAEPVRRTRCEAYKTLRGIKWQKKNLKTILKL